MNLKASQTFQSVVNVPSLNQAIKTRGFSPKTTEPTTQMSYLSMTKKSELWQGQKSIPKTYPKYLKKL